ncbi:hypothetical protein Cgig2_001291 [Carnegiea gigantea]|uniref:Uncharacterized protein n=1 Tax=Carnegiea gigantea TaxID=171969 RepID=A0A9Q1KM78_9CARY|nr:hypothetical protein Cgig2_001291 [Carnegiea gigantea]
MITHGSSDAMGNPAEHASLIKEAYWEKGKNRLKDMVSKVSKKKPTDRKGGDTVTAAKLFSKTHTKPKDKTFADDRSKATWVCIKPIHLPFFEEDNSLFLEAVGGWSEKGTVYGLGNSVSLFYEKPTNNATANKPSYTPSVIAQLQTKLDSMKTELNSIKNKIQQQRTSREEQQRKMAE